MRLHSSAHGKRTWNGTVFGRTLKAGIRQPGDKDQSFQQEPVKQGREHTNRRTAHSSGPP